MVIKKSNTRFSYIAVIIKNQIPDYYIYITVDFNFFKKSNNCLKTCWVFSGSFMKLDGSLNFLISRTDGSFNLIFFFFPNTQNWQVLQNSNAHLTLVLTIVMHLPTL